MPDPYGGFHGSPGDAQLLMTLCLAISFQLNLRGGAVLAER